MRNKLLYPVTLCIFGCGFIYISKTSIQAIAFSLIIFLFLTYPLLGFLLPAFNKKQTSYYDEELELGIGS